MQRPAVLNVVVSVLVLVVAAPTSRGANVLENVPQDALGFVVARDFGSMDAKVQRLFTSLQLPLGGPLAFLQAATGIHEGLDTTGDFLVAVLPDDAGGDRPKFCIWLPVADYNRFVASLGSKPVAGVTAVTVAGVDLLVANDGAWALVMDPDQRERMERILAAKPTPPRQVLAWQAWIDTNDATAVALSGGLHDLLTWAASAPPDAAAAATEQDDDNLFGPVDEGDVFGQDEPRQGRRPANDMGSKIRAAIREMFLSSPKTLQWAHAIEAVGCGVRLDEDGNLLSRVRAVWNKDSNFTPAARGDAAALPASLFDGGQFIVHGAGNLPQPLTAVLASAYVRMIIDDLKLEMGLALDSDTVARFQDAVEQAAAAVPSAGVLTLAGAKEDGVYTNNFLVVRVESADAFVDQANEVMRLWNQMNREADDGTRLVFDVDDVPMGDHSATHYALDVAALDSVPGAPVIPEVRQAMEKLFGAGGKMRLIVAPVDDHNVLLAMATPEQAKGALKTLRDKRGDGQSGEQIDRANQLLPHDGDWRIFVSPHGYKRWFARQMDAMTGPVIGGPIVKEFPASPPIGVVGGAEDYELWMEAAVPAETIQATGVYIKNKSRKNPR